MSVMKSVARRLLPRSARNWLRQPAQSLRWGWASLRAGLGGTTRLELRPGWPLRSHPGAYSFAYHAQADDPDQVAEFDQFIRHCTAGMTLFDLGTHFGLFSLAALHFGGPAARAVAVDPSPLACRVVRFQSRANGLSERIRIVQAAAGDGGADEAMVSAGIGSAGYFVRPSKDHPTGEQVHVTGISIDGLVATTGWMPTHVKIDVEGYEAGVLRGGSATFARPDPPLLFLELHNDLIRDAGGDPQECLDILAHWGLETWDVRGRRYPTAEILAQPLTRLLAARPGTAAK